MTSGRDDREAEIARLTQVAERVARRTNTEFEINPYKRRNFAAGAANPSGRGCGSSPAIAGSPKRANDD